MFESVGWGEILVLIVAGLFILGPERLPSAAAWLGQSVRKVRDYATGAREQLRSEVGPEFDELRKPLEDLRGLRNMDPKRAVTKHLFDGDDDYLGLREFNGNGSDTKPNGHPTPGGPRITRRESLKPGEQPPVDPDAT
ncbi:MAG: Sec-independent protein translocase subunit TatB [Pseudonocardiaceae bacterium]|nr:Sec-independent protein translocase subunit TatB [Pseudonocardiaceae bacterium]